MMSRDATAIAPLTFGSLFSGIGGLDLGLERAGMQCQWQVEIDDYATKVLEKHWPNVARFRDIRDCGPDNLTSVDLICGGFPCQDISDAGKRAGITGKKSGLWKEYYRIICALRPRYVVIENVSALVNRGLSTVLRDLAQGGYDAEWQIISAAALGAWHIRKRIFILAYTNSDRCRQWKNQQKSLTECAQASDACADGTQKIMADPDRQGLAVGEIFGGDASTQFQTIKRDCSTGAGIWTTEPNVGRVADGVPSRVDRLTGLGNAVVPQLAELVGRLIIQREVTA